MTTADRIQPGDRDPRHGTENGYKNLLCRCEPCRAAHAAHHRTLRTRPIAADDPRHGLYHTYTNHDCRCRPCTDAWALNMRGYRAKRGVPS